MTRFLSSDEAAEHCGLSTVLIRKATESGDLAFYKVGRLRKYRPEDLDVWVESLRVVQAPIRIVRAS